MKKNKLVKWGIVTILLILIISIILFSIFYSPQRLVEKIGVENSYLVILLFAIFGGVSAFTSATFYTIMATFYTGGLNFFWLIFLGAIGLTIGDSFFYYFGKKSHDLVNETKYKKKIIKLKKFLREIPPRWAYLFIVGYASITPFPKDILCIVLGILNFSYKKFLVLFLIGNFIFNLLFLYLFSIGLNLIIVG